MRTSWRKLMSNSLKRWQNPSLLNSTKRSSRNFFPQASPTRRQCGGTAKSLQGTRSRISSEIFPRVGRISAHSASGTTSNEVLKTSHVAHAAASMSLKRLARLMRRYTIKEMVKINSAICLLSELCNFSCRGFPIILATQLKC